MSTSEVFHKFELPAMQTSSDVIRDQVIDATHIPSFGPLYAIAPYPKRVNFASQQTRAFNLVWALTDAGRISRGASVAVIGAGVAGLTVASALARRGIEPTVFEASDQTMKIQRYTTSRFVHPTLNYWPMVKLDPTANFPCLYWSADNCSTVISTIRSQWEAEFGNDFVNFDSRVTQLTASEKKIILHLKGGRITTPFDAVILAVGFGLEQPSASAYLPSYWGNEDPRSAELSKKIYISGIGDGGLLEALRLVYEDFEEGQLTSRLAHVARRLNLEKAISDIETEAASKADIDPGAASTLLALKYQTLPLGEELGKLFDRLLQGKRTVILVSRGPHAFALESAPIHRLMLAKAIQAQRIQVLPNTELTTRKGAVMVGDRTLQNAETILIIRHGPAGEIGKLLSDKVLDRLEAKQKVLSQYQYHPLWPENYFSSLLAASLLGDQQEKLEAKQRELEVKLTTVLPSLGKEFKGASFEVAEVDGKLCYRARLGPTSKLTAADLPHNILGERLIGISEPWKVFSSVISDLESMINSKPLEVGDRIITVGELDGQRLVGTIGAFVRRNGERTTYAMSAQHIMGRAGTLVFATGKHGLYAIGRVSESISDIVGDVGFVELDKDVEFRVPPDAPTSASSGKALVGRSVATRLENRATRRGRIVGIAQDVSLESTSGSVVLSRAFIVSSVDDHPFATPGNSGALVTLDDGCALGIVTAGAGNEVLVSPIEDMLVKFQAQFIGATGLPQDPYLPRNISSATSDNDGYNLRNSGSSPNIIGEGVASDDGTGDIINENVPGPKPAPSSEKPILIRLNGVVSPIARALTKRGYETLTPVQQSMLEPKLGNSDVLVSAQTGSGKTVAFGLALATTLLGKNERFGQAGSPMALVIAPTRELALQVQRELEWLFELTGAVITSCVGGMDMRTERRQLDRGAHMVIGTPGRLCDHIRRNSLDISSLQAVVLDEADEMLDLGFREDLEFILETSPAERRTLMFSATVPRSIATLAKNYQRDAVRISTAAETKQHVDIEYRALTVAGSDRENAIINVLRYYEAPNAIVFCSTRAAVNHLTARFNNRGFSVVALSGELSQSERTHALQAMRDGRARVCIATDVAARGIDLPGLDLVVHADLPTNPETLLHRSGRTGRAGRQGVSAIIVPMSGRRKAERLLEAARINATWAKPPSADDVTQRDDERLLANSLLTETIREDETAFVQRLLKEHSPEQVAAAFLRQYRAGKSAPEDLVDVAVPAARKQPQREDNGAPRTEHPSDARADFADSKWVSLSVGRKQNAEPRWLIPMICRYGDLTKRDIGAIRMQQEETYVELSGAAAERFLDAIGPNLALEKGIRVKLITGAPDTSRPSQAGPKRSFAAKKPRGDFAVSGGKLERTSKGQSEQRKDKKSGKSDFAEEGPRAVSTKVKFRKAVAKQRYPS